MIFMSNGIDKGNKRVDPYKELFKPFANQYDFYMPTS